MPVTQADVAKRAGVSIKQVSRVINNENRVADATRRRVLEAIEELGYAPNLWAQRLARGYSQAIGLCFYDATSAYITEVLRGMLDVGEQRGYRVSLYRFNPADEQAVAAMIAAAGQLQVDGFVLSPPCDNAVAFVAALRQLAIPFVQVTPHDRSQHDPWVAATDEQGAYDATVHLIRLGHSRIGFIQGPREHTASWHRLRGFERALAEFDIPVEPQLMRQGDWTFETGLHCTRELLALSWPPSAIVAACDDVATGAIQAIWERGWRCPQDISVVGFDDNLMAAQVCPPLTTVRQPIYRIAATAASLLIDKLIPGEPFDAGVILETELVVRRSTAPAPLRAAATRPLPATPLGAEAES
jgi:LacI family transcriptional regulator